MDMVNPYFRLMVCSSWFHFPLKLVLYDLNGHNYYYHDQIYCCCEASKRQHSQDLRGIYYIEGGMNS